MIDQEAIYYYKGESGAFLRDNINSIAFILKDPDQISSTITIN